jgi:hypothetical protein
MRSVLTYLPRTIGSRILRADEDASPLPVSHMPSPRMGRSRGTGTLLATALLATVVSTSIAACSRKFSLSLDSLTEKVPELQNGWEAKKGKDGATKFVRGEDVIVYADSMSEPIRSIYVTNTVVDQEFSASKGLVRRKVENPFRLAKIVAAALSPGTESELESWLSRNWDDAGASRSFGNFQVEIVGRSAMHSTCIVCFSR